MNHDQQDKPSFFALIKGNINQLKVPPKIVMNLGEELWKNESIILIGSSGEKWQVSILRKENDMYLQNIGWEKFLKENSMMNEEFLFFTYNGENRFQVGIFSRNGLERPSFKKAEVAEEAPTVVKRKRGRPSLKKEEKVAFAAEAPIVGKRKRGRPRKNPAAETACGKKEKEKEKEEARATLVAKKEKEKEAPETMVARRKNDEPRKNLAAKRVCVKKEKEEAVETMESKKNKGRPRKSATPSPPVVIIID